VAYLLKDKRKGDRLPFAKTYALLLEDEGLHLATVRPLAAFRDAWCCLAFSSAVRDIVEGRRLWQRQPVRTWLAADRGEVDSMAELPRCGTSSEDGAGDFFVLLT
jgi:hypothetical protein